MKVGYSPWPRSSPWLELTPWDLASGSYCPHRQLLPPSPRPLRWWPYTLQLNKTPCIIWHGDCCWGELGSSIIIGGTSSSSGWKEWGMFPQSLLEELTSCFCGRQRASILVEARSKNKKHNSKNYERIDLWLLLFHQWLTNFLFFEAPFGGGASLLLRVLYGETVLAFNVEYLGAFAARCGVLRPFPFPF